MKPLQPLRPDQATAAAPGDNAWVSASAGTGKTQVLSARVLRLLLDGARPDRILCLTFTKAGAAEMQARVFDRLAHWVRATDAELTSDLVAIRADTDGATRAYARTLFAHTLDARGGLNIQTLHGYAQSLLAAFPLEAGVAPGFATLAERDALALRGRVLAESIEAAAAEGDTGFLDDVGAISVARGAASLDKISGTLIRHASALATLGPPVGFEGRLRRAFGLPVAGSHEDVLTDAVAALDHAGLKRLGLALERAGGIKASKRAETLLWWLAIPAAAQVANLSQLFGCLLKTTDGGIPKDLVPVAASKADPGLARAAQTLCEAVVALAETAALLEAAANAARHLRVGARLCAAYGDHKRRAGVIDYDDMIAHAAALLTRPGMSEWVRFKLDQRIDHLLVDEAQDTNAAQWDIVRALTDEFFDGEGAREVARTLFVVGDFKQAIFSFQGSDPRIFNVQKQDFSQKIGDAQLPWRDVPLTESFRSVPAVLDIVETVVKHLGHEAFGAPEPIPPPRAARRNCPGAVTLWPPLVADAGGVVDPDRTWLPPTHIQMAHCLARQIKAWLTPATALRLPARDRDARPEDILVLVRNRGDFVQPLIAALHAHGVPVAGADRLRLTEPLAVQDCLALVRFALQPRDDLTCATLLTSPFIGLDHDALFDLCHGRAGSLWDRVRAAGGLVADWLGHVLALADFSAPYEFLEAVLSGPLGGRALLLRRLGEEAREAVQAVLAQALAFETANAPTLQGFLAWMEGQNTDIKRDPDAPIDAVRIMTVHGAKGLQAPIVVLADATRARDDRADHVVVDLDGNLVPVFHGGKPGKVGRIGIEAEAAAALAMQEHWRLLYVALTRAEDLLFIGGALTGGTATSPAKLPGESWYAVVAKAIAEHSTAEEPDAVWGTANVHRACIGGDAVPDLARAARGSGAALPGWARTPAPQEARPSRPLSPSAIAADDIAAPPPTPAMQAAARRGQLLHALFERLPAVALDARAGAAARWLGVHAPDLDDEARGGLVATALGIVAAPRFTALFGPDALAEAPIAAVVDGVVIAGKVDRLLVGDTHVQLIDFKTGARVPGSAAAVEPYHLKQMAAYVAALGVIFPGRRIDAALLYTHDATLIDLPADLLATHRPRLGGRQATLGAASR